MATLTREKGTILGLLVLMSKIARWEKIKALPASSLSSEDP